MYCNVAQWRESSQNYWLEGLMTVFSWSSDTCLIPIYEIWYDETAIPVWFGSTECCIMLNRRLLYRVQLNSETVSDTLLFLSVLVWQLWLIKHIISMKVWVTYVSTCVTFSDVFFTKDRIECFRRAISSLARALQCETFSCIFDDVSTRTLPA